LVFLELPRPHIRQLQQQSKSHNKNIFHQKIDNYINVEIPADNDNIHHSFKWRNSHSKDILMAKENLKQRKLISEEQ